jgi:hypothetical protein
VVSLDHDEIVLAYLGAAFAGLPPPRVTLTFARRGTLAHVMVTVVAGRGVSADRHQQPEVRSSSPPVVVVVASHGGDRFRYPGVAS